MVPKCILIIKPLNIPFFVKYLDYHVLCLLFHFLMEKVALCNLALAITSLLIKAISI